MYVYELGLERIVQGSHNISNRNSGIRFDNNLVPTEVQFKSNLIKDY